MEFKAFEKWTAICSRGKFVRNTKWSLFYTQLYRSKPRVYIPIPRAWKFSIRCVRFNSALIYDELPLDSVSWTLSRLEDILHTRFTRDKPIFRRNYHINLSVFVAWLEFTSVFFQFYQRMILQSQNESVYSETNFHVFSVLHAHVCLFRKSAIENVL